MFLNIRNNFCDSTWFISVFVVVGVIAVESIMYNLNRTKMNIEIATFMNNYIFS